MTGYFTKQELYDKCQEREWLAVGGLDYFEEESEYPYNLKTCETLEELKGKFASGGWAVRQAFAYERLCFVNQINGGDEWWALYKHPDGRIQGFESITFRHFIEIGEFENLMERLLQGPDAYWRDEEDE